MKIKRKDGTFIEYVRGDETPVSRNENFSPTIKPDYEAEKQMIEKMREKRKLLEAEQESQEVRAPDKKKSEKGWKWRREEAKRLEIKTRRDWIDGIAKVKYLGSEQTVQTSTGSMIGRSIVGGALFGDAGALAGAATAKQKVSDGGKNMHKFFVIHKTGYTETKLAKEGTTEYYDLMKLSMKE